MSKPTLVDKTAAEAEVVGLDYQDVLADPEAAIGQPVRWHLTHGTTESWHYNGDYDKEISFWGTNPDLRPTGCCGAPNSYAIVGQVHDVFPRKVVLNYVGRL